MIPRFQRILFWSLVGCIFLMFLFLLRGCEQAHERLTAKGDLTPLTAPAASETETVTLYLASDADTSITPTQRQVALPEEPTLRARALLEHLLGLYTAPGSAHPLQNGAAVDSVFIVTLPADAQGATDASHVESLFGVHGGGQVAVVNLHGSFADQHPSGVVVEALTLQSIIGTLHSALPGVEEVRFLVDGRTRETLAGHASLLRAYPAVDTANRPLVTLSEEK
jgi:hypothetical protein